MEALRCNEGVGDRASMLIELGLPSNGLRGAPLPLPFDEVDGARSMFGLEGDASVGEDGRAAEAAVLSDRRLKECASPPVLLVDCKGVDSLATLLRDGEAMVNTGCSHLLLSHSSERSSQSCLHVIGRAGHEAVIMEKSVSLPMRTFLLYANPCFLSGQTLN